MSRLANHNPSCNGSRGVVQKAGFRKGKSTEDSQGCPKKDGERRCLEGRFHKFNCSSVVPGPEVILSAIFG